MNPFEQQKTFMTACGQTTETFNVEQFNMYVDLINEELSELRAAINNTDQVETLDALVDILVVTIGAAYSLGADIQGAWAEVIRSNMTKVDPTTGQVIKRADGKVLKPATYSPPNLSDFILKKAA